jgi:viroplasmin and RNaseH domain-containing protein
MGRDGGGDTKTFPTMEEAEKYVAKHFEQNTQDVKNYEGDKTDSGRGNASEDGGGFYSFKVVRASQTFSSEEEAKKSLSDMADKADYGDDSIAYAIGTFKVLDSATSAAETKKKETKEFSDTLHKTLKIHDGEAFLNGGPNAEFVECSQCHSKLARSYVLKKRIHLADDYRGSGNTGVCPLCNSETATRGDAAVISDQ